MWDCDSTKIQRAFLRGTLAAFLVLNITLRLLAEDVTVRDANEFRRVAGKAGPGTRILLAPGYYAGGFHLTALRGTMNRPIVIGAADTNRVPVIESIHLSSPMFVEFHHLIIAGWSGNGLNIDDGGTFVTPAEHLTLRNLVVTNTGPGGNRDCIKLSGVVDFQVEGCVVEGWGTGGGSGIDMVGCHRGLIVSNVFRHSDSIGSTGVQCKGGTTRINIQRNRFENAGGRAVNIGGSTGRAYFRPPLDAGTEHYEARDIRVEGNTFIGSSAAVAFVGVDGAVVCFNTIYRPKKWAIRILQENNESGFVPSRKGEFTDNIVVFHSSEWSTGGVNVGPHTAPETFRFARNWWYCLDQPAQSRPRLPAPETEGVYGKPIHFRDAANGDYRVVVDGSARYGADAFRE